MKVAVLGAGGMGGGIWFTLKDHTLVETHTWPHEEDQRYYHDGTTQTLDIVRRVHEGLPPATPARDAYETMRVVFAAEKSADEGRTVKMEEV